MAALNGANTIASPLVLSSPFSRRGDISGGTYMFLSQIICWSMGMQVMVYLGFHSYCILPMCGRVNNYTPFRSLKYIVVAVTTCRRHSSPKVLAPSTAAKTPCSTSLPPPLSHPPFTNTLMEDAAWRKTGTGAGGFRRFPLSFCMSIIRWRRQRRLLGHVRHSRHGVNAEKQSSGPAGFLDRRDTAGAPPSPDFGVVVRGNAGSPAGMFNAAEEHKLGDHSS
ncbi:hypothetical protein TREMEDRAFT_64976 [Tremella mesenterica DSM 1558]|uniref:uncharacterized protein n=1 Tax=Tremella mesenterica (strain ATCC 24925 / CBS 8224 / DSM 1558 / NBRC 9311 / NRRL Y-6157 / RJB 2259-6 / UBC 559-6) TaxID=578456 RepID=UPI0003F49858|nr:uncharacterized protein TREMEDRAFT_64976 [Tremella mesenterica DSM 1558]EIW67107.1 hypothetical protein TREMEDRAFT_64976 [Tremella mesenterica DSM 1558]